MQEKKNNTLYIVVGVIVAIVMIGLTAAMTLVPQPREGQVAEPAPSPAAGDAQAPTAGQQQSAQPSQGAQDQREPAQQAPSAPPSLSPEQQAQLDDMLRSLAKRDPDDKLARGEVDAPVVMIEWADFQCPYCAKFGTEVLPQLQPLIDSGELRYEFRDMVIFGEESLDLAVAARAAGEQGKHFEYMHAAYASEPAENEVVNSPERLKALAEEAGVPDLAKFEQDLHSADLQKQVLLDTQEAQQLGFRSVPAFIVGTEVIQGAQPVEVFQQVIQQELEKATN